MKKKILLSILALAAIGAVVFMNLEGATREKVDQTISEDAKKVEAVKTETTDATVALDQANTSIDWTATKVVLGKNVNLGGGWDDTGKISGGAILAADGSVKQLTATIEVVTVWTESDILTGIMRKPETGFFATDKHPNATFISTAIKAGAPTGTTMSNATHTVEGNFQLNGIEKSITFPAMIKSAGGSLELAAKFGLNRQDYNCKLANSPAGVLLGDKDIFNDLAMSVKVKAKAAAGAAAAGTTAVTPAAGTPAAKPVDLASLAKTFTQTVEVFQVKFDMVLVPGDEAAGVKPIYVGKTEVSWDEFMPWVYTKDITDSAEAAKLRAKKLRPSLPYGEVSRGYGNEGFPALSMSKLSAELYCKWLSEQTGRNYRLPTEKEWEHFNKLGRGGKDLALAEDEAKEIAVYEGNSFVDENGDYQTRAVGSKKADAIGLHDVAGNLIEWVTDTGKDRVVRGGHFKDTVDLLGAAGRLIEDMDVWNMNYPNEPKSIWWFVDAKWVGFRVVCDP